MSNFVVSIILLIFMYKGTMTFHKTHQCTSCNETITYKSSGGWYNARTKLNRTSILRCQPCAGKEGRANSDKQPTGRPKGTKNSYKVVRGPAVAENFNWHKEEVRMLVVARRNGYDTYDEYLENLPDLKRYRIDVKRITENQPLHLLENIDKRSQNGTPGGYTLDHKVSVLKGFKEGIPANEIGHISNLQMLPWKENIQKGWK